MHEHGKQAVESWYSKAYPTTESGKTRRDGELAFPQSK